MQGDSQALAVGTNVSLTPANGSQGTAAAQQGSPAVIQVALASDGPPKLLQGPTFTPAQVCALLGSLSKQGAQDAADLILAGSALCTKGQVLNVGSMVSGCKRINLGT